MKHPSILELHSHGPFSDRERMVDMLNINHMFSPLQKFHFFINRKITNQETDYRTCTHANEITGKALACSKSKIAEAHDSYDNNDDLHRAVKRLP